MTPEAFDRVKSAHAEALGLTGTARDAFLDQAFASEPELAAELRRLLACHDEAGDFLADSLPQRIAPTAHDLSVRRVGPYELLDELGHGGSASVYLARRADDLFERRVAIKILNRLSHSQEALDHFQREVRILASIEHPYVVRMLDAGITGEALAYIVTEYIKGQPVDRYCTGLSLRTKIELFIKICDGVAAAHRNLIVHRDLKPSNVLITADGTPKLLDFGIAIPAERGGDSLTRTGQERWTAGYASPEQIRGEKNLTTVSDVFCLGVLLHELIAQRHPFPYPPHEVAAHIATEEPPPIATVPRDVNAIVRKAMHREPTSRYDSVDRLRDDLQRFLDNRPVLAHGDGSGYRVLKFVRKHAAGVTVAAVVAIALGASATVSWISARRARAQSERVREVLMQAFDRANYDPAHWYSLHAKRLLEMTRLAYLEPLVAEYGHDPSFDVQRFGSWRTLGNIEGLPSSLNLGHTKEAIESTAKAVEAGEALLRSAPHNVERRGEVGTTHIELGSTLLEANRREEAVAEFSRAQELAAALSSEAGARLDLEVLAQQSRVLVYRGHFEEAAVIRRRITEARRGLFDKNPEGMRWEFAGALCSYGELLREMGRSREAEPLYVEARPMIESLVRAAPRDLGNQWHLARENQEYARVLLDLARTGDAIRQLDRAISLYRGIAQQEPDAMSNQRALAVCLWLRGSAMLRAGQSSGAASVQEALALSRQAAQADPVSFKAQRELAAIQETAASFKIGEARVIHRGDLAQSR